jgi:transcriptional regulator with XRE-family HTH domain
MGIREIFATNLRSARKAAGLSQEELALRAGVDRTYVSSLERCVYAAGLDVVDKLAKEIGVEAYELLRKPEGRAAGRKVPPSVGRKSSGRKKAV